MKSLKLVAKPREDKGSAAMGRLRKEGMIPAVVYGDGKPAKLIQLNLHEFEKALRGHSGEHMLLDLEVEGDRLFKALIKEVQHHPVSGKVLHADFNEVSLTKKLSIEIPIRLVGEPTGVTQQGGVLEHLLRQVEVECLPTDIIEQIDVDVSALNIGDKLTVADIKLDVSKYVIVDDASLAIAAVSAPRVEEEAVVAEVAAVPGAGEPEVIREKKVGEEEEEGEDKKDAKGEGKKEAKGEGKKEAKSEGKEKKEK